MSGSTRQRDVIWASLVVALGFAVGQVPQARGQTAEADQRLPSSQPLEQLLESLELDRLLVRHVEAELARELSGDRQVRLARRLAELYQRRLLEPDRAESDLLERAQAFMQRYPDLEAPGLELAILHARYLQAETEFRGWWFAGAPPAQRPTVLEPLQEVGEQLRELHVRLERDFQQLLGGLSGRSARPVGEAQRLATIETQLMHCDYLLGWSRYFQGVAGPSRTAAWAAAEQRFRRFLELAEDQPLVELQSGELSLSSGWHARAVIGLAMTLRGRQDRQSSEHLFDLLGESGLDATTRTGLPVWQLEARLFARDWASAVQWVRDASSRSYRLEPQRRLWVAAIQYAPALERVNAAGASQLRAAGVQGLLRQFAGPVLQQLVERSGLQPAGERFQDLWLQGYLQFEEAGQNREALATAEGHLRTALQQADSETVADEDRRRVQFLLAMIDFRRGAWAASVAQLREVASGLRVAAPEVAEEALWWRIRGLTALSLQDARHTGQALAAMDQFRGWFRNSTRLAELEAERLKLNCNWLPPEIAVQRLEELGQREPPDWLPFELVRNQHRRWQQARQAGSAAEPQEFQQLVAFDRALQQGAGGDPRQKMRSRLLVGDALLQRETDPTQLSQWLEPGAAPVEMGALDPELRGEWWYLQWRIARLCDPAQAVDLARRLVDAGAQTPYERPALLYLVQQAPPPEELSAEDVPAAIDDYTRLVSLLGKSVDQLRASRNSRVALFRLVQLCLREGQWVRADRDVTRLLEAFPDRRDYVLAAARIRTRLREFARALPLWRQLAAAVTPGSDEWYESKYELVRCLQLEDPAAAHQVLRQTRALSPDLPEPWREKYNALAAEFGEEL